ncbi:MAG: CDP-alcohol phosphatidyltransferase family protein [Actinomycetota bacterium]|nr:CDP-alcohol phosphatidyltransferase family protein [Actinomycetota bacterium]
MTATVPSATGQPVAAGLTWRGAPIGTWANVVTAVRTVVAVGLGLWALPRGDAALLVAAYAVYWVGDILDGWVARRRNEETRLGAVLDIVSDRACCAVLVGGLVTIQPHLWPALAVFLVQFMVLDCALSLSFLRWPILSPNHFAVVDARVYALNWSPPAKAVNTAGVVLAVVTGSLAAAGLVAVAQLALKLWSARRVCRLDAAAG